MVPPVFFISGSSYTRLCNVCMVALQRFHAGLTLPVCGNTLCSGNCCRQRGYIGHLILDSRFANVRVVLLA